MSANFVITGPIAAADAASRVANSEFIKIPISTLLANDSRIATNGSTQTDNLTITAAAGGAGNTASICGTFVCYTPATDGERSLHLHLHGERRWRRDFDRYRHRDGDHAGAQPFAIQILGRTTAVYNGTNTSISVEFLSAPGQSLLMEYMTNMTPWTAYPPPVNTGSSGDFVVTFTVAGDHAADWNNSMFFRATRQ